MNQNLAPTPDPRPSAIESLDVREIIASGVDPFLPLAAAVLADCKRPVSDLRGYLTPAACSEVERYMAACADSGVRDILAASGRAPSAGLRLEVM